jgi:hypothetical protein
MFSSLPAFDATSPFLTSDLLGLANAPTIGADVFGNLGAGSTLGTLGAGTSGLLTNLSAPATFAGLAEAFGVTPEIMKQTFDATFPEILSQMYPNEFPSTPPEGTPSVPPGGNPTGDPTGTYQPNPQNPTGFNPWGGIIGALLGALGGNDNDQEQTKRTETWTRGTESRAPDSALIPFLMQTMQQLNAPPEQAYLDAVLRPLNQAYNEVALPGILSQAGQAGQVGGSRQGVAQGIAARGYTNTVADTLAKMAQERERTAALFGSDLASKWYTNPTDTTTTENITQSADFGGNNRLANILGGALMGNQLGNVLFPQGGGNTSGGGGGNTFMNWLGGLMPSSQTVGSWLPDWLRTMPSARAQMPRSPAQTIGSNVGPWSQPGF